MSIESRMCLDFYVEESSAEAALVELVPRILHPRIFDYNIFPFQGKNALLRNLPNRLKAYRYRTDDWRIIVLIDRDGQNCRTLKNQLEQFAHDAGLTTRANTSEKVQVVNRIAIEELEAWFFGDMDALIAAYPRVDPNLARKASSRDPDAITGGTWEKLQSVLADYHPGGLEKIRAAEEISRHMQPGRNRSKSFQVFRDALLDIFDV